MAGRAFTRRANGAGNRVKAEHINELQLALEADDTRIDAKPDIADVQDTVRTELSNNPTVTAAAADAAAAAVPDALAAADFGPYVGPEVDAHIAADPGFTAAAETAVDNEIVGRDLLEGGDTIEEDIAFAVVDEHNAVTVLEIGLDGNFTARAAAKAGIPADMDADVTGIAFAVVDENDTLTDIEIGDDGHFTQRVMDLLAARLGSSVSASQDALPRIPDPSAMTLAGAGTATTWPTYDGSGVVVHPSVLYIPQGFGGYRWWAAITPYPGSDSEYENPEIYVSADGTTWTVPPGVTNPLDPSPDPGYNSDTHLYYGAEGVMYLLFREVSSGREILYVMETTDGVSWSTPVESLNTAGTSGVLSPAIWYDAAAKEWVMLACQNDLAGNGSVRRRVAPTAYGPWSTFTTSTISPALSVGDQPWHMDARPLGGQIVALIQTGNNLGGALYLAVSDDNGHTFTRASTALVASGAYRSCLVPFTGPGGLYLDVWIGSAGPSWGVTRNTIGA